MQTWTQALHHAINGQIVALDGKTIRRSLWCLFHRLPFDEADSYLRDRAAKRFTVIQAVALAEKKAACECC